MKILIPISLCVASFLITWLTPHSPEIAPTSTSAQSLSHRKTSANPSPQKSASQELIKISRLIDPEARLQHLIALANSIPIEQLPTWLTSVNLAPLDPSLRTLLLTITCDRWLEAAPADLILWNSRTNLVDAHHYLAHWLTRDRESASHYLRSKPTGFDQQYSLSRSIEYLAKLDFNLAFDFAKEQLNPSFELRHHTQKEILFTLAKQAPETFSTLAPTLPESLQNSIAAAFISSTFEADFPGVISQLANQEDGLSTFLATRSMIGHEQFIDTLVQNTDHLPDGWLQQIVNKSILSYSSKILPLLETGPDKLGITEESFAKLMLRQQWHDFGIEARPRLLDILNNPNLPLTARKNLLAGQLQYWLQDPSAELKNQLNTLQDPALRDQVLERQESAELLLQNTNPKNKTKLPVRQFIDWTPSQTQEALTIFKNASPSDQRSTFQQIKNSSRDDQLNRPYFAEVLATIATQAPPSDPQRQDQDLSTTAHFTQNWALDSPAQAAEWVQKLPPGDHRLWAAKNVAQTWQLYSPSEAAAWVKSLPAEDRAFLAQ